MEDTHETVVDYQSLAALTSQIFEDQLRIRAAGIEVRGWSPNHQTGLVQLRVASDQAEAQAWVDESYGIGRVEVIRTGRPPASRVSY